MIDKTHSKICPTLLIGLGNAGYEILLKLRQLLHENESSDWDANLVKFLHICIDPQSKRLRTSIKHYPWLDEIELSSSETLDCSIEQRFWLDYQEWTFQNYPDIAEWLSPRFNYLSFEELKICRPYGRLCFVQHVDEIKSTIEKLCRTFPSTFTEGPKSNSYPQIDDQKMLIFIIYDAGSPEAGMCLDLPYLMRSILPDNKVLGYLSSEYSQELNTQTLSPALQKALKDINITVTETATVHVEERNVRWIIQDQEQESKYQIVNQGSSLHISQPIKRTYIGITVLPPYSNSSERQQCYGNTCATLKELEYYLPKPHPEWGPVSELVPQFPASWAPKNKEVLFVVPGLTKLSPGEIPTVLYQKFQENDIIFERQNARLEKISNEWCIRLAQRIFFIECTTAGAEVYEKIGIPAYDICFLVGHRRYTIESNNPIDEDEYTYHQIAWYLYLNLEPSTEFAAHIRGISKFTPSDIAKEIAHKIDKYNIEFKRVMSTRYVYFVALGAVSTGKNRYLFSSALLLSQLLIRRYHDLLQRQLSSTGRESFIHDNEELLSFLKKVENILEEKSGKLKQVKHLYGKLTYHEFLPTRYEQRLKQLLTQQQESWQEQVDMILSEFLDSADLYSAIREICTEFQNKELEWTRKIFTFAKDYLLTSGFIDTTMDNVIEMINKSAAANDENLGQKILNQIGRLLEKFLDEKQMQTFHEVIDAKIRDDKIRNISQYLKNIFERIEEAVLKPTIGIEAEYLRDTFLLFKARIGITLAELGKIDSPWLNQLLQAYDPYLHVTPHSDRMPELIPPTPEELQLRWKITLLWLQAIMLYDPEASDQSKPIIYYQVIPDKEHKLMGFYTLYSEDPIKAPIPYFLGVDFHVLHKRLENREREQQTVRDEEYHHPLCNYIWKRLERWRTLQVTKSQVCQYLTILEYYRDKVFPMKDSQKEYIWDLEHRCLDYLYEQVKKDFIQKYDSKGHITSYSIENCSAAIPNYPQMRFLLAIARVQSSKLGAEV